MRIETEIKRVAMENGAGSVGIAAGTRLIDAPPSGDPKYLLPTAQSIISFTVPLDKQTVLSFISKRAWLPHNEEKKRIARTVYTIGDRLVDLLKSRGFEAINVDVNNNYRPEPGARDVTEMTEFHPEFSHRYGAIAAGIGRLGWSGNVLTPDHGAMVELGTVITSAELQSDNLLETNPCDKCKMCALVCPVGMIHLKNSQKVTIAGITEEIAEKRPNTCCWIGCTGYHGVSLDKKWSNWSPYSLETPLPATKEDMDNLNIRLQKADPLMHLEESAFTDYRKAMFNSDWFTNTVCGNCRNVCWQNRVDREHNRKLIIESGIVALGAGGEHIVTREETIQVETPYIVRVTLLKREFDQTATSGLSANPRALTPMDAAVLNYIYGRK